MKRTLLLIAFGIIAGFALQAQSFVIKDKEGTVVTGQTIDFLCAPEVGFGSINLDVFNVSDRDKSVKVRRYDGQLVESSEITMCWASCYPANVIETPEPVVIQPGSFTPNFTGDIAYGSIQGVSSAVFVFFDQDNQTDSSFVTVNFIIGTLGVNDKPVVAATVSNAYPNPAVNAVNFDYKLPSATQKASIRISNLLGTTVQEIALQKSEGKARIDVSNLNNGVYFYSLMINNSATTTRKFIVKR